MGAYNNDEGGVTFVYAMDKNGKWKQHAKLHAPDGAADDRFGWSIGVYDDIVVISAYWEDDKGVDSRSVHLFYRDKVDWTHLVKLVAPDGAAYDAFGDSVGIYNNIVVVGAWGNADSGSDSGYVHLFR